MKGIAIMCAALALCACDAEERYRRRNDEVRQSLPRGCELHDLGYFHTRDSERVSVVIVTCEAFATRTSLLSWDVAQGKSRSRRYSTQAEVEQ